MGVDFAQYQTAYQRFRPLMRKELRAQGIDSPRAYYDRLVSRFLSDHSRFLRDHKTLASAPTGFVESHTALLSESEYYRRGQVYYKVYPDMAKQLAFTDLKIPCEFFKMPQSCFEMRLDKESNLVRGGATSCLVWECSSVVREMMGDESSYLSIVWHDSTDMKNNCYASDSVSYFQLQKGEIIDDRIKKASSSAGNRMSQYNARILFRLAVAVSFFGSNRHELICPDIPRRYRVKHEAARNRGDTKRMLEIERKSSGFVVGREIDLPAPIGEHDATNRDEVDQARELKHGHVRRGHMRMQPCGLRSQDRKLMFIAPTVIRPDLPLMTKGYRIR